jgi:hypothetical protein
MAGEDSCDTTVMPPGTEWQKGSEGRIIRKEVGCPRCGPAREALNLMKSIKFR